LKRFTKALREADSLQNSIFQAAIRRAFISLNNSVHSFHVRFRFFPFSFLAVHPLLSSSCSSTRWHLIVIVEPRRLGANIFWFTLDNSGDGAAGVANSARRAGSG